MARANVAKTRWCVNMKARWLNGHQPTKIHFIDVSLQSTLTRLEPEGWFLLHYRDKDQVDMDFVLESPLGRQFEAFAV